MKKTALMITALIIALCLLMPAAMTSAMPKQDTISGKVVETMDSGGYTYVCLENNKQKTWVAVPQMKVAKGAKMSFMPGAPMQNFKSKTLNRTFDVIYFSPGVAK